MSVVFNDTTTLQGVVQHVRDLTGQDALSIEKATRYINFALDDYSYIAITSDNRWKFDASTHVNSSGNKTLPRATYIYGANKESVPLNEDFLTVNRVSWLNNGKYYPLSPVDSKDDKKNNLSTVYESNGDPVKYDYDGHNLFLYPKPPNDITVKIEFSRAAPHFGTTDTTAEIGIPSIHIEYIAVNAAYKISFSTNDPIIARLKERKDEIEDDIRDFYSKRDEDTPHKLIGKINIPQ